MSKFARGLIPDKSDDRDFSFKYVENTLRLQKNVQEMPKRVDLRRLMSPIRNQGNLGSCTAQAVTALMESVQIELTGDLELALSPLFLYYNTRKRTGDENEDTGASLRDAIKTASAIGVCGEVEWPYQPGDFTREPTKESYDNTGLLKVCNYYRVGGLSDVKKSLAYTNPVVMGLMLYESFESDEVGTTGIAPLPDLEKEECIGGHAVLAIGYCEKDRTILFRNSWGTEWGKQGYFTVPYEYVSNRDLCIDKWTCTFALDQSV